MTSKRVFSCFSSFHEHLLPCTENTRAKCVFPSLIDLSIICFEQQNDHTPWRWKSQGNSVKEMKGSINATVAVKFLILPSFLATPGQYLGLLQLIRNPAEHHSSCATVKMTFWVAVPPPSLNDSDTLHTP